ncbi:hypothetical protein TSUD_234230 [Trifolium subterraneum]|uniref:F-box associated domain-containing protein n=1 Tax=Trifolium subterraneum TaxID=3900 RepID=A0A2Z6LHA2_TRISU|nr:hypothetical protein TSUD_234230 [Trifolium subterraneum]
MGSNNHLKLAPMFKLPLRDAKSLRNKPKRPIRSVRLVLKKNTDKNTDGDSQMLNNDVKPYHDRFGIVNSCNGFLSLCCPFKGNPLVICNPVTGEFMRLPNRLHGASILLYHSRNCLIYYEPDRYGFKVFRIHGTDSELVEIIPHIPSLVSLKDVVEGGNIEVLNIYSM